MSMEVVKEGVYFLYDEGELVYIGTSNNLYQRIGEHIADDKKKFDSFELYPTTDRLRLEGFLIDAFKPKYNSAPGKDWRFFRGKDCFPNSTIQEAIKKYDEYMGDPYVDEIADEINSYKGPLLRGLVEAGAPVYKINDYFRLDRKWYDQHKENIWHYVL